MRVIKPTKVKALAKEFPDAAEALMYWLEHAEKADWQNLIDVRQVFPHADPVVVKSKRIVTIFNLRGNRYRLVTAINYRYGMLYVLRFMTHAKYDKDKWKAEL
jgi:mRNA interferase HigB